MVKHTICHIAIISRIKNNSTSDKYIENEEGLEFSDFDSFIEPFRKYKKDLSEAERQDFMIKQLDELERCSRMEQQII